jgi:hypothetical protein
VTKVNISKALTFVHEPGTKDVAQALFVAVFMAREHLSLAERDDGVAQRICGVALEDVEKALRHLQSAENLLDLEGPLVDTSRNYDLLRLARQCLHGAEAAEALLKRHNYTNGPSSMAESLQRKQTNICKRSIETARKDTHKLLAAVMERFPDSYDVEKEEEEEQEV